MSLTVRAGNGRLLIPRATYDQHLAAAATAALLVREGRVLLVPLTGPMAGGLLLKQRNLAGDRVLLAPDLLVRCGHGDGDPARDYRVHWSPDEGALWIEGLIVTD
ncbi:hypothetical protein C1M51_06155 [Methylibium sp. Pch-M]|uniref:hypothetical protein n=1 Tax=Methylibium sp. Pch-M TaxID=2082386 RepID=UPI00101239FC|nr:hypothetical protein [Methylibium sp. Pch-M]QAZ39050.1 hypothetical protein C1M51_06155 [Methylibium sp. Pch-M]